MQNKKSQSGVKNVVDMLGKSDMDSSGRGSFTSDSIETGVPATLAFTGKPGVPATMSNMAAAPQVSGNQQSSDESDEEETEESSEPTEVEEQVRQQFRSALIELLGEENANETLIGNLEAIFEAAVTDRVEKQLSAILVELDEGVKNHLETVTESLVEKVDDYLDYVVEEWMQDNAIAVEQGIKTQIAENFITGMKNLFENHYIDVPAEKYNVLDELYAQNQGLNEQLNSTINENINLKKQVALTECAGIFVAETKDLVDTQIVKLQNLMENVTFTSPEEYRDKLLAVKQNYLARPKAAPKVVDVVETFSQAPSVPTTLVEGYASALGRINKKV